MKIKPGKNGGKMRVEGGKIRKRGTRTILKPLVAKPPVHALAPVPGESADDRRKVRNARKRERRSR